MINKSGALAFAGKENPPKKIIFPTVICLGAGKISLQLSQGFVLSY